MTFSRSQVQGTTKRSIFQNDNLAAATVARKPCLSPAPPIELPFDQGEIFPLQRSSYVSLSLFSLFSLRTLPLSSQPDSIILYMYNDLLITVVVIFAFLIRISRIPQQRQLRRSVRWNRRRQLQHGSRGASVTIVWAIHGQSSWTTLMMSMLRLRCEVLLKFLLLLLLRSLVSDLALSFGSLRTRHLASITCMLRECKRMVWFHLLLHLALFLSLLF